MPYVICDACHLTTYSVALQGSWEQCPRCNANLHENDVRQCSVISPEGTIAAAWDPRLAARPKRQLTS
ncbi:MAG: hypothetical protein QOC92_4471 [Acidimicrobiaceae bacterium]|jgi:uncharacterized paraquat-inducible protein A